MIKVLFFTACLLLVSACSSKKAPPELKYLPEEFDAIMNTTGAAPDKTTGSAINFSDYSPGVNKLTSRPLMYQRLGFVVLEFQTETQARNEALRLNQYYSRNYVFDKVEGEPVLEDMVLVKFHGQNPKRRVQRTPINIPTEHHDHGAPAGGGGH